MCPLADQTNVYGAWRYFVDIKHQIVVTAIFFSFFAFLQAACILGVDYFTTAWFYEHGGEESLFLAYHYPNER